MKTQTQIGLFALILYLPIAFCRKPDPSSNNLTRHKSQIQFVDYITGIPISNLQVKRWNYKDSSNGGTYLVYKDSFQTDSDGNCIFERSEVNDYLGWTSVDYFDDDLETVPGNGLPRTNSLYFVKTDDNVSYYQAKLFPKIEVTIHIKQVTPIKTDSTSIGTYLYLSSLAYNNGSSRNEISLITEQNFLPKCYSCTDMSIYPPIKENELLDIKINGYLAKNLFNNLKFSIRSYDSSFFPLIFKEGILSIENRIIGPQPEILFIF
jgi:hypothetical protein